MNGFLNDLVGANPFRWLRSTGANLRRLFGPTPVRVRPGTPDLWRVERGDISTSYHGSFAASTHAKTMLIPGRVVVWAAMPTDVYLHNPPPLLMQHPKAHCLQLLRPGDLWFKLHWERAPRDFESSRAFVEQMMAESLLKGAS